MICIGDSTDAAKIVRIGPIREPSMRKRLIAAVLFLLGSLLAHAEPGLPKDVRSFITRRDSCEHFRGEIPDPSEKRRMKEVVRQINAFCKGTDKALALMKKKYSSDSNVMSRLNEYEDEIEAHPERRKN